MTDSDKPVGDYLIVVVRPDTTLYSLGLFESRASALKYALEHRSSLGLERCLSWDIEKRPSDDEPLRYGTDAMTRDETNARIKAINRELDELRERRGKEPWGSPKHTMLREEISSLLEERDELSKSR